MTVPAIRTEGLTKRYGDAVALDHLDLEVAAGEVVGYLGPNGAGKTTTIRLLLGLARATGGRAEIFGLDARGRPVEAHRRLAYVAGEANLWPSLTGAETLPLLGRVQGQVDEAYRDELVDRFDLDPTKKVRAYSKGNRQKVILIAALMVRPRPAGPRRAHHRPRPADGAGLPPLHPRGSGPGPDGLPLVPHHERGGGALRPGGHPPQRALVEIGTLAEMRHLRALTVEATFDGPVPDLSGVPGVTRGAGRRAGRSAARSGVRSSRCWRSWPAPGVTGLLSREPSLEELFLAQYGGDDRVGGPARCR